MRYAFFYLFSRLPFPILYVISNFLAFIAKKVVGYRKNVILKNLRNAFPEKTGQELQKLIPGIYRNLTDVVVETIKLLTMSKEELNKRAKFNNIDVVNQYYLRERSIIITTSHSCNWEWMLGACSINASGQIDAVYQGIKSPFFEKLMFQIRGRFGALPVEKNVVFRESLKKRNIPHILALVADQSPPYADRHIHWVKFLNQETAFYNGMERIGVGFDWPVIFARMKRLRRGFYEMEFIELETDPGNTEPGTIIEKYARIVEASIQENPSDWLWSHKRWKRKKQD